ncbi:MAG: hypothetical protein NZ927_09805 [Candidatus Calescibacterium sp.]|nr:hypothetical protein [Candidatus Calescibacterium sp.]
MFRLISGTRFGRRKRAYKALASAFGEICSWRELELFQASGLDVWRKIQQTKEE